MRHTNSVVGECYVCGNLIDHSITRNTGYQHKEDCQYHRKKEPLNNRVSKRNNQKLVKTTYRNRTLCEKCKIGFGTNIMLREHKREVHSY